MSDNDFKIERFRWIALMSVAIVAISCFTGAIGYYNKLCYETEQKAMELGYRREVLPGTTWPVWSKRCNCGVYCDCGPHCQK